MLPKEKTKTVNDINSLTALIYGPSKIGKSTFCSRAEKALFLSTEPGLNSLEVFKIDIKNWEDLLNACKEIEAGEHEFKTIVIDTIDNAYQMCRDYFCKKNNVEHESDIAWGKCYALINAEFQRVINKLAFLPYGLILVSHSMDKEVESRTGKYTKTIPTIPEKARQILIGLVDLILFCDIELKTDENKNQIQYRIMRTKPNVGYDAGDRTGIFPDTMPLSYPEFKKVFYNHFNKEKK